jgi:hypothetical protein
MHLHDLKIVQVGNSQIPQMPDASEGFLFYTMSRGATLSFRLFPPRPPDSLWWTEIIQLKETLQWKGE